MSSLPSLSQWHIKHSQYVTLHTSNLPSMSQWHIKPSSLSHSTHQTFPVCHSDTSSLPVCHTPHIKPSQSVTLHTSNLPSMSQWHIKPSQSVTLHMSSLPSMSDSTCQVFPVCHRPHMKPTGLSQFTHQARPGACLSHTTRQAFPVCNSYYYYSPIIPLIIVLFKPGPAAYSLSLSLRSV